jgi:hypothetical protein
VFCFATSGANALKGGASVIGVDNPDYDLVPGYLVSTPLSKARWLLLRDGAESLNSRRFASVVCSNDYCEAAARLSVWNGKRESLPSGKAPKAMDL